MLLEHLDIWNSETPDQQTSILIDNKGAIMIGHHPTNKAATHHVDMRIQFLRQHVEVGTIL
jgi:hypothetical protein